MYLYFYLKTIWLLMGREWIRRMSLWFVSRPNWIHFLFVSSPNWSSLSIPFLFSFPHSSISSEITYQLVSEPFQSNSAQTRKYPKNKQPVPHTKIPHLNPHQSSVNHNCCHGYRRRTDSKIGSRHERDQISNTEAVRWEPWTILEREHWPIFERNSGQHILNSRRGFTTKLSVQSKSESGQRSPLNVTRDPHLAQHHCFDVTVPPSSTQSLRYPQTETPTEPLLPPNVHQPYTTAMQDALEYIPPANQRLTHMSIVHKPLQSNHQNNQSAQAPAYLRFAAP